MSPSSQFTDEYYMAMALRLAERGRYSTQPNPRVGCVIVKGEEVIGEGFHQRCGDAHAEINALAQAGARARGSDVFVTLEPCSHQGKTPPCAAALIAAQVKRVVISMIDPNPLVAGKGVDLLEVSGIDTSVGVAENSAKRINRGFIKRMETGKPFVTLKLATSLDGRIAMQSGESAWITSAGARKDAHKLRLEHCALITGINTVLADDPRLTVRLNNDEVDASYSIRSRQPVRIILDSHGRLNQAAQVLQQAGETWQVVADDIKHQHVEIANKTLYLAKENKHLNLTALLTTLGDLEMNNVLVEAGGILAASFIKADLVDELVVYQSADIMGSSAQPMFDLVDISHMRDKIHFEYQDMRRIGRDIRLTLAPNSNLGL